MALKSIYNIFPLIDDPANIFYSKIKQWFQLQSNFHLHCKAISRVDRVVEANFMGISRIYKCKFKTYKVLTEEDIDKYLYIRYTFIASKKDNFELTSSGERIPVDISDLYILEDSPKPVVLGDHTETILYEPVIKDSPYEKQHYYVYIRVNKIYKNEYSLLDIENTEIDYEELHFDDVYHPSIGRLWCIKKRSSVDATKKSVLDKNYEWKLYNIDSDDNYSLMDSDMCIPESFGTNVIWSAQYGPGLDHKSSFTCTYKDDDVDAEPPSELTNNFSFWIEIRETEWAVDSSKSKWSSIDSTAEPYLNTRGVVPAFFPYLFNGLHFNVSMANSIVEFLILLLSYVCNMNIHYLLCGLNQSPLYEVVNAISGDTVDSLLATGGDPTKSMLGVYSVTFTPHDPNDSSSSNYDTVTYTKNSNNTTDTYSNHDLVEEARNRIITDSLTHNNLPVPILPQIKWYIHQWVYALSFKKYSTRTYNSTNHNITFQGTTFSVFKVLEEEFIKINFVQNTVS